MRTFRACREEPARHIVSLPAEADPAEPQRDRNRNTIMAGSSVFAIRDSGFNAFLLADVGIETNGSPLTVLSMLARLGVDPWERAARWASEPRATATEALAASLSDTAEIDLPLDHARTVASRLMLLLPGRSIVTAPDRRLPARASVMQNWAWVSVAVFWLYMILTAVLSPATHPPSAVATPRTSITNPH